MNDQFIDEVMGLVQRCIEAHYDYIEEQRSNRWGAYESSLEAIRAALREFARLVELETLERAARVCDGLKEKYSKMADDDSDVTNGYVFTSRYWSHVSALSGAGFDIRNLKETNDKE